MAHKTKVNGTAYEIVGGSTRVNGTNYNIIKGKTNINGTNYDIDFEPPWEWVGWDNATWDDVIEMLGRKKSGKLKAYPSDVVLGATKPLQLKKSLRPSGYSSGYWIAGTYTAHIIELTATTIKFLWQVNKSSMSMSWEYYTQPIKYLNLINNATDTTDIDGYMTERIADTYYYPQTDSYGTKNISRGRFFVPKVKEWKSNTTIDECGYPYYYATSSTTYPREQTLTLPSGITTTVMGTLSGSNKDTSTNQSRISYWGIPMSSKTPTKEMSAFSMYLYPCFEITG